MATRNPWPMADRRQCLRNGEQNEHGQERRGREIAKQRQLVAIPAGRPFADAPRLEPVRRNAFADLALSGVYEISKLLTNPQRLEVMLGDVVSVLSSFLDMRRGMIVMLEAEGEPEIVCTGGGWSHEAERALALPQGAIDQIVATATPLVVDDIGAHPLFHRSGYLASTTSGSRVSFIGVPIKVDDKVRGTLSIRPRLGRGR